MINVRQQEGAKVCSDDDQSPMQCTDEADESMSDFFHRSAKKCSSTSSNKREWKSGSDEPSAAGDRDEDPMTKFFRRSSSGRASNDGERLVPDGYEWNTGGDECPTNSEVEGGKEGSDGAVMSEFFGRSSSGRSLAEGGRSPSGYEWKPGRDECPASEEDSVDDPMSKFFRRSSLRRSSPGGRRLENGYEWRPGDDQPPEDAIKRCDSSSFTSSLAYDPVRIRLRTTLRLCTLNLARNSAILDRVLGVTSAFTFLGLCLAMIGGIVYLMPSMFFSKMMGWPSFINKPESLEEDENISTTEVGSVTAIKALVSRAQMNLQGSGGPDNVSPLLMGQISALGPNIPGSKLYSQIFMFMERLNFYLTGRIFQDQIAQMMKEKVKFGVSAFIQVRTCWIDDCVETFVRKNVETKSGKANVNVVILGAGFDTRCYRMNLAERGVQLYEVDAPGTQAMKRAVLADARVDHKPTKFVSCNFEKEDWLEKLKSAGFNGGLPTFFVWEGVTMYISRQTVKATIEKVGLLAKGSMIGFDYLDRTWALSDFIAKRTKSGKEPWVFGMTGAEPEQLIAECNKENSSADSSFPLTTLDNLKHSELARRYLATHYDGRPIGFLGDFGGFFLVGST